ncbi:MAG: DUF192 domain-containing protein [Lentisphaeria bacterium]|nr:DUF192 domain-containing protein [Lentisphaeria bacterium]
MIRNLSRQTLLAENEYYALGFRDRLQGMIGRRFERAMDCMVFPACNSIHMFFMGMELDAVFLDRENRIVKRVTAKPWRIYWGGRKAYCVLELPAGRGDEAMCRVGDVLDLNGEACREKMKENGKIRHFTFSSPELPDGKKV